jgi:hypothetical protein
MRQSPHITPDACNALTSCVHMADIAPPSLPCRGALIAAFCKR